MRLRAPTPARVLWLGVGLLVLAYAAHLLWGRGRDGLETVFDAGVQNALLVVGAGSCLAGALRRGPERLAWLTLAAGLACWAAGNVLWSAWLGRLPEPPYPSLSDALWLAFYPAAYVSLVLLVRARVTRFQASLWLDGLVGALGAAAVAGALIWTPMTQDAAASTFTLAVNLAYPLADVLLMAVLAAVFAVTGGRPGRDVVLLAASLLLNTTADVLQLFHLAAGGTDEPSLRDLLWVVAQLLMAAAACQPAAKAPPVRLDGLRVLAVPLASALVVVGLMVDDALNPLPPGPQLLVVGLLVAVFVRGGFALHENMRLIQAREEALTDELTGLANRRGFYLRVPDLLHGEPPHAVLVADLDRFKDVNDRLGHQAGDDVLRDAARRLRAALPDAAMLARLGGDEFAAVVELRGEAALAQLRARLTDLLVTPFATPAPGLSVSASVGVAPVPRGERDVDDLLRRADAAMYAAKRAGIGVRVAAPGGRRRDWLAPQLEAALDRGELVLHYQPQMEIATGRVAAVEALVRWQHPERGLLAPDAFLPLAEGAGLLGRLTRRVLRDALDQRRAWAAAGHDLPVAVNLGAGDVLDRTLPGELSALLDGTATSPDRLHLELSERVALQGAGRAPDVLAGLRGLGVSLALTRGAAGDEAEGRGRGTAGSSPLDLEQLGADALKLDRTLVAGLPDDPDSLRVVRSAIALARELGLRVIAEGVERAEELAALAGLGCELAQGYHLSRPLPPEELEAWLDAPQLAFAQRSSRGSSASATTRSTAAGRQGPSSSAASSR